MTSPILTIPVSTVPAVTQYLLTQIEIAAQSDPASGDFLVCLGEASVNFPSAIIEVGSAVRRTVEPRTFIGSGGQFWLNEKYDIDIKVSAAMETVDVQTDPLTLTQRAWQLLSYVETAVRLDPSLGDLVNEAYPAQTTGGEVVWSENNIGRICELTVPIHCEVLN